MFLHENEVQKFREKHNERLPKLYRWPAHIFFNFLLLFFGFFFVEKEMVWTFPALFTIVFFVFIWGVIEYFLHRFLLHGQPNTNQRLKREHSVEHHGYFTHLAMTAQRGIDTNRILLFPADLATLIGLNLLVSFALGSLVGKDIGLLFCFSGLLYTLLYESLHAICHLSTFENSSVLKYWTQHHKVHHDKKNMGQNFSVVFPFLDLILGTRRKLEGRK